MRPTDNLKKFISVSAILAVLICVLPEKAMEETYARKVTLKMKTPQKPKPDAEDKYRVVNLRSDCTIQSDTIFNKITVTGYDKKSTSSKESFFIINESGEDLAGLEIEILYLTLDGRQLHKRKEKLSRTVPAGETIKMDIDGWDSQHSFHYRLSDSPKRRQSIPYEVKIKPVRLFLFQAKEGK